MINLHPEIYMGTKKIHLSLYVTAPEKMTDFSLCVRQHL